MQEQEEQSELQEQLELLGHVRLLLREQQERQLLTELLELQEQEERQLRQRERQQQLEHEQRQRERQQEREQEREQEELHEHLQREMRQQDQQEQQRLQEPQRRRRRRWWTPRRSDDDNDGDATTDGSLLHVTLPSYDEAIGMFFQHGVDQRDLDVLTRIFGASGLQLRYLAWCLPCVSDEPDKSRESDDADPI